MKLAAAQGLAAAQCNLGTYFLAGIGGEKSQELGKEWLENAAVQGDRSARRMLKTITFAESTNLAIHVSLGSQTEKGH